MNELMSLDYRSNCDNVTGDLPAPNQSAQSSGKENPPRPNILFVLTDDLGIGDIGVFFQNARRARKDPTKPYHSTPHLDRLAEDGIRLERHYCPAPVCAPSRASLLLGVHQGHANVGGALETT